MDLFTSIIFIMKIIRYLGVKRANSGVSLWTYFSCDLGQLSRVETDYFYAQLHFSKRPLCGIHAVLWDSVSFNFMGRLPWVSERGSSEDLVETVEGTYNVCFIQLFLEGLSLSWF